MSSEITEDDLKKLAQDMVAAGNLNALYGIDSFLKAKTLFEEALKTFGAQAQKARPPEKASSIVIQEPPLTIPDFLKRP